MSDRYGKDFTGLAIEHRSPDGPARRLAETTVWSIATASAQSWVRRLRRQGQRGTVAVVKGRTGRVLTAYPIDPESP